MAKGIQSILLGFRLLKTITDSGVPVPLKTIASLGGMSPSKARMYLISLIETGLIVQNMETGLYSLGPYAFHLGTRAMQRMESMAIASEAMRSLQQQTQSFVLLCAWEGNGIVIVSFSEGSEPLPLQFRIGGSPSLAGTATGHAFLAFGPQEEVWNHLAEEIAQLGLNKAEQRKRIQALEAGMRKLRQSRLAEADPIAYSSGVTLSGFAALAAPIFDENKRLRYVLTLIYRTDRQPKREEELIRLTLAAADRASMLAGGR